ncbi:hypothetical protein RvY_15226 [Ramazzottius varieornatus]|uniref:Secreted protein n=1 Tax=Ramazzottius varieornatus TaxID=947166 RepID=A0A1D1VYX8_RAMVA|nr:hypothetical protein RvY_15226 [Ramazzottius varieornatus]
MSELKYRTIWACSLLCLVLLLCNYGADGQGTSVTAEPPGMHWTLFPLFNNGRQKREPKDDRGKATDRELTLAKERLKNRPRSQERPLPQGHGGAGGG